jgi:hypothetical protein
MHEILSNRQARQEIQIQIGLTGKENVILLARLAVRSVFD